MKKPTSDLLKSLKNSPSVDYYLKENQNELFFDSAADLIEYYLITKNLKKAEVIERSHMDRTYAYQIINGSKKNPGRDKLIMLCYGLTLNLEETNRVLKMSGYPELYPRNLRDVVIIRGILERKSILDVDIKLYEMGLEEFIKQKDKKEEAKEKPEKSKKKKKNKKK
ncbi:MAG: hypothetical protein UFA98_05455 [Ruminococcus sp.]|nr:hypothetical protein [Ruminococcus sp.]